MEKNKPSLLLLGLQEHQNPQYFNCYQIIPSVLSEDYLESIHRNTKNPWLLKYFLVINKNTEYPAELDSNSKIFILKWDKWTGLHTSFLSSNLESTCNVILFDAVVLNTVSVTRDQFGIVTNKSGICLWDTIDLGDYYINFIGSIDFIIQTLYDKKKDFVKISGDILCIYPDYSTNNYLSLFKYKKVYVYDLEVVTAEVEEIKRPIVDKTKPQFKKIFKEREKELQQLIAQNRSC
jgi:hypothetical protein